MASSKCSIEGCKRNFDIVCEHCQGQICTKHYIEHVKSANTDLTFLSDELNSVINAVQQYDFTHQTFERLEQWRKESHRRIDELCEEKKQQLKSEVEQKINHQMKKLRELSLEVKELIDEGDASFKQIEQIKKSVEEYRVQCEQFKVTDSFQLRVNTINLDMTLVNERLFRGDGKLLSPDHQLKLNEFYGKEGQMWMLIYKATRDGFASADFHRCCDNQGPTIVLIQSKDNGYLFGGYTSVSWHPADSYVLDANNPFLFTLTNPHGIPPTKYPIKISKYSIYTHENYCPTFGAGHDIYLCSNSHTNKTSSFNFPHSYYDTTNRGAITFTGNKNFQTNDLEIYRLIQS